MSSTTPVLNTRRKKSASTQSPITRSRANSQASLQALEHNAGNEQNTQLLADHPSKWKNWWIRGFWTAVMVFIFPVGQNLMLMCLL